ncbi:two-component system, NtrC family, sensor histidine kinase PilS [Noviherbaspirillum humi]|uniref:histidine kinase n=1 Tax=Noviherbaspirillum humi TaxID=1688639 RepID=A0A239CRX5_9BURK|nr:ATP-binding protein [Noviherbaspirillum humi]SNS22518.1 two-component system, NtrC family, sensor histidine kinase PilS [Noviherbaspirillum humi]
MSLLSGLGTAETRAAFWRPLQTFGFTRIVIVAVLLLFLAFNGRPLLGNDQPFGRDTYLLYLAAAIGFWLLSVYQRRYFLLQLLLQLAIDIACITLLYVAAGGVQSGLAILYLFPLCGGAILTPLVPALFLVSVVTLIMLGESGYQVLLSANDVSTSRAGLFGAAFFAAVFLINRLAGKLIKQEDLAAQRGRDLRVQEAINQLIIADMEDGILVTGPELAIFACNPAAERMLGLKPGMAPEWNLDEVPALQPIADAFLGWMKRAADGEDADASAFVVVKPSEEQPNLQRTTVMGQGGRLEMAAHLRLRFARVRSSAVADDRAVIFLQDMTRIESQAQELKLASMGRLTASIAHEVRNPLSAIGHAASLLKEDLVLPTQQRLLKIIGDNVSRLNRMIEDILKLSRKAQMNDEELPLASFLPRLLGEFGETQSLPPTLIGLGPVGGHTVRFDPLHLEEVLVNLLTNALRYASKRDGSIRIWAVAQKSGRLELHVQDDGPGIEPKVRAHLFEPFYTTSSKGTGLGLYLARELCLNNGAMLDYEYRHEKPEGRGDHLSGRFVITLVASQPALSGHPSP